MTCLPSVISFGIWDRLWRILKIYAETTKKRSDKFIARVFHTCLNDVSSMSLTPFDLNSPAWLTLCYAWIVFIIPRIAHRSLESVALVILPHPAEEIDNLLELSALDTLFLRPALSENLTNYAFVFIVLSTEMRFEPCSKTNSLD